MSVTQVGVWAPLRAAGIVSRLTVLTMKRTNIRPSYSLWTHSLKICLKPEAETFTTSPVWLKRMEMHFEFNFVGIIFSLLVIVLGYSVLVDHCTTDKGM